jgi:hypothetical protein
MLIELGDKVSSEEQRTRERNRAIEGVVGGPEVVAFDREHPEEFRRGRFARFEFPAEVVSDLDVLQQQDAAFDRIETMVSALARSAHLGGLHTVVCGVEKTVAADSTEAENTPVVEDHIVDLAGHIAPFAVDWFESGRLFLSPAVAKSMPKIRQRSMLELTLYCTDLEQKFRNGSAGALQPFRSNRTVRRRVSNRSRVGKSGVP